MSPKPPSLTSMLEALIATPSVSSVNPELDQSNEAVIDLLADWLEAAGFRTERMAVPERPGKFNLIATLGTGPGGLVLAGHTDTVPCNAERWRHDPFRLTEDSGRLYGLGTSDMKSFFGIVIEAVRGLTPRDLRQPLVVLATADEESSMRGARALVQADRALGRYALIGEPTGLTPVRLHKGVMWEAVRLIGQTGHASDPGLGRNALDGMQEVMGDLMAWREELGQRHRHPAFTIPGPTLNLGRIHGGVNPNLICGDCELHLDLRLLPDMRAEDLRAELTHRVAAIADRRGLEWQVAPLFPGIPPTETPRESAIVEAGEALTGHTAEAANFGTEAPFFNQLGMETLILGPGNLAQAHQPDEYLETARIPPTLELLKGMIRRFCRD
ncbi:MAG: acetylornithine deacetylase [Candidatus Thiosymbion ectosymbiont of Robbea hypermnestra]|nr:acetylornithine deacetylase [Candidatus Thiosymbion ectosymbiont of Robbea hypermnestra]